MNNLKLCQKLLLCYEVVQILKIVYEVMSKTETPLRYVTDNPRKIVGGMSKV